MIKTAKTAKTTMTTKPLLTIVASVDSANLTHTSWNQTFLERVAAEHRLLDGQAVVFTNKVRDRCRLVARVCGLAVLIMPPVDCASRVSLYITVSRFLRSVSDRALTSHFDKVLTNAQLRLSLQKKRAAALAKKGKR